MASEFRTTSQDRYTVLYDGDCRFCQVQLGKLMALARPGAIEAVNFQQPGVLVRFPGLTHEACMKAMHLVTLDGRVYRGFEAAVRAVATRRIVGWLAYAYYVPGLRQLLDAAYRWIAARRYRIMGKAIAAGECPGGTCALHAVPTHTNNLPENSRSEEQTHG
jgi:predicted DCC family thiol-disulfide oxidoreductase YuxK